MVEQFVLVMIILTGTTNGQVYTSDCREDNETVSCVDFNMCCYEQDCRGLQTVSQCTTDNRGHIDDANCLCISSTNSISSVVLVLCILSVVFLRNCIVISWF